MLLVRQCRWFLLSGVVFLCAGCVEGPFGGFPKMNPYLQRKWAEDEKFGPTFHRRLSDLQGVRDSAAQLDPQKKEQLANSISQEFSTETNSVLRAEMVGIFGELATPSVMPALQAAVQDADEDVRIAACHAWTKLGANAALPVLTELMQRETDVDVRLAAIAELGKFQDPNAVSLLGEALDDNDPAVQHLAVQSLKTSTGRDFGESVPAWRDYVQGREPRIPPAPSFVERFYRWF